MLCPYRTFAGVAQSKKSVGQVSIPDQIVLYPRSGMETRPTIRAIKFEISNSLHRPLLECQRKRRIETELC